MAAKKQETPPEAEAKAEAEEAKTEAEEAPEASLSDVEKELKALDEKIAKQGHVTSRDAMRIDDLRRRASENKEAN